MTNYRGTATILNGFGVYVVPVVPCIFGGFSGSSNSKVNFCRSATVLINSSVLDRCSPGQARLPTCKIVLSVVVLVDRKTDGFQDEISPNIKKFAWNG